MRLVRPESGRRRRRGGAVGAAEEAWRRYLAAERGEVRVIPPADCQVALVYPSTYAVGMSSLGYQMIYRWINEHPRSLAERFFCGMAPALSVENQRPLDVFNLIAFSVAFELDYLEVVRFLLDGGVPVRAANRDPAAHPIVLLGGVCLSVNRLPVYDLADVLIAGDGENIVSPLLDAWAEAGGDGARFFESISSLPGVEPTEGALQRFGLLGPAPNAAAETAPPAIAPNVVSRLDSTDACSAIVTPEAEFSDRFLVEIARGCPYRCTFCFLGSCSEYRPRSFDAVREMIDRGRALTDRFGLIAGAVGRHPEIDRICEYSLSAGLNVSFSSLRLEDVTTGMVDLLVASGQQSVTVAPEAGSERLRRRLGKRLTDEQVMEFAADAVRRGMKELRFYFMVGIPAEEAEDIDAIAGLVESTLCAARAARPSGRGQVRLSVNTSVFVPKPGTPLAQEDPPSATETRKRLDRLERLLGRIDGVEFRKPSVPMAKIQRYLAWGGRSTLNTLIDAAASRSGWRRKLESAADEWSRRGP